MKSEHEAQLVSGGPDEDEESAWGVPWVRLSYKGLGFVPSIIKALWAAKRSFKPQLLHLHQPFIALWAHLCFSRDLPRLYHFHSYWGEEKMSHAQNAKDRFLSRIKGHLEHGVMSRMDAFVVLSEYSRSRVLSRFPKAKVHLCPGAVSMEDWAGAIQRSETLQLLSVRRLDPRMGLDLLLEAMAEWKREQATFDVHLRIVGTGREEERLKVLVQSLGLQDEVCFEGRVSEQRLRHLMLSHHGMIIPTREMEGFGMSVVEALAAGLPVLCTEAGALGEFAKHGDVVKVVGEPTVANLKAGLKWCGTQWVDQPEQWSERCRQVALEHYSDEVVAQKLMNIYGNMT